MKQNCRLKLNYQEVNSTFKKQSCEISWVIQQINNQGFILFTTSLPRSLMMCTGDPRRHSTLYMALATLSADLSLIIYLFIFILPPETYLQCVYIGKITIDTKNT